MHRMRCLLARVGPPLFLSFLLAAPAAGELIKPPAGAAYPDIAGAFTGTQNYSFDPTTQTGLFQATNTPLLLATGPAVSDETIIQPDESGIRAQDVNLTLDPGGRLVSNPGNSYTLHGTVVLGGKTFQGLLLQGVPTAFGSQGGGSAAFNLDLKITGGALASKFGPEVYLELHPSLGGTFDGSFSRSFSTSIEASTTLGYHAPNPAAVPEPTTLVVLLACGAGWLIRHRRRRFSRAELELPD